MANVFASTIGGMFLTAFLVPAYATVTGNPVEVRTDGSVRFASAPDDPDLAFCKLLSTRLQETSGTLQGLKEDLNANISRTRTSLSMS